MKDKNLNKLKKELLKLFDNSISISKSEIELSKTNQQINIPDNPSDISEQTNSQSISQKPDNINISINLPTNFSGESLKKVIYSPESNKNYNIDIKKNETPVYLFLNKSYENSINYSALNNPYSFLNYSFDNKNSFIDNTENIKEKTENSLNYYKNILSNYNKNELKTKINNTNDIDIESFFSKPYSFIRNTNSLYLLSHNDKNVFKSLSNIKDDKNYFYTKNTSENYNISEELLETSNSNTKNYVDNNISNNNTNINSVKDNKTFENNYSEQNISKTNNLNNTNLQNISNNTITTNNTNQESLIVQKNINNIIGDTTNNTNQESLVVQKNINNIIGDTTNNTNQESLVTTNVIGDTTNNTNQESLVVQKNINNIIGDTTNNTNQESLVTTNVIGDTTNNTNQESLVVQKNINNIIGDTTNNTNQESLVVQKNINNASESVSIIADTVNNNVNNIQKNIETENINNLLNTVENNQSFALTENTKIEKQNKINVTNQNTNVKFFGKPKFFDIRNDIKNFASKTTTINELLQSGSTPNITDNLFLIPAFMDGGIVSKPTMALMGEKEPEMIIPKSKLPELLQDTSKNGAVEKANIENKTNQLMRTGSQSSIDTLKAIKENETNKNEMSSFTPNDLEEITSKVNEKLSDNLGKGSAPSKSIPPRNTQSDPNYSKLTRTTTTKGVSIFKDGRDDTPFWRKWQT